MHYDIQKFRSYEDFLKRDKAYNKGSNAYPLGERRYSHKHYRIHNNGEIHILYANRLEMDKALNPDGSLPDRDRAARYPRRHLATVRPDNSITLHNINDMGDYKMLEAVTGFSMVNEAKRGGLVIRAGDKDNRRMHFGFKGLRFMLDTGDAHPECKYSVHHKVLNRTAAQEYMKQYEEFLVTYPVMLKVSTVDSLREMMTTLRNDIRPTNEVYTAHIFECLKNKHYLDAAVALSMKHGVNPWWYMFSTNNQDRFHAEFRRIVDTNFRKDMLSNAPLTANVFNIKRYEGGEYFPTSQWRTDVYLDGVGTPSTKL